MHVTLGVTSYFILSSQLEVQKYVGVISMKKSIEYCLKVSEKYNYEVYFILLCTGQISQSVKKRLSANLDNPYIGSNLAMSFELKTVYLSSKLQLIVILKMLSRILTLFQYLIYILLAIMKKD